MFFNLFFFFIWSNANHSSIPMNDLGGALAGTERRTGCEAAECGA